MTLNRCFIYKYMFIHICIREPRARNLQDFVCERSSFRPFEGLSRYPFSNTPTSDAIVHLPRECTPISLTFYSFFLFIFNCETFVAIQFMQLQLQSIIYDCGFCNLCTDCDFYGLGL